MKFPYYLLLSLVIITTFILTRCSNKTIPESLPVQIEKPKEILPASREFYKIFNKEISHTPTDSLYTFYEEVKLHPNILTFSPQGQILWNDPANKIITKSKLRLLDKNFKLLFTSKREYSTDIFQYENLPICTAHDGNSGNLLFYDLNQMKPIKEHTLKGTYVSQQELPDNQLMVTTTNYPDGHIYLYHFKREDLIKVDSIKLNIYPHGIGVHPSQKFIIDGTGKSLLVHQIPELNVIKEFEKDGPYNKMLFSNDGERLILIDSGFNITGTSKIKILSFPEFNEIGVFNFKSNLIFTLKEKLLLVGDKNGSIKLIDISSGVILYSNNESKKISSLGIIDKDEILIGKKQNNQLNLVLRNIKKQTNIKSISTKTDYIRPVSFSPDSKEFYFYENKTLSKINLETLGITPIEELYVLGPVSLNSDGTKLAFKVIEWKNNLIDLTTGKMSSLPNSDSGFIFGGNPNELIFAAKDSVRVFNIETKKWSKAWKHREIPQFAMSIQAQTFRNPLDKDELIFSTNEYTISDITHFNEISYEYRNPFSKEDYALSGKIELLGVDSKGNYYLSKRNEQIYVYDSNSLSLKDSISGKFNFYNTIIAATTTRDALCTTQNNQRFIVSPHNSEIYQKLEEASFYWFSPNLEYFIQTHLNSIKIYKWK